MVIIIAREKNHSLMKISCNILLISAVCLDCDRKFQNYWFHLTPTAYPDLSVVQSFHLFLLTGFIYLFIYGRHVNLFPFHKWELFLTFIFYGCWHLNSHGSNYTWIPYTCLSTNCILLPCIQLHFPVTIIFFSHPMVCVAI